MRGLEEPLPLSRVRAYTIVADYSHTDDRFHDRYLPVLLQTNANLPIVRSLCSERLQCDLHLLVNDVYVYLSRRSIGVPERFLGKSEILRLPTYVGRG